MAELLKFKDHVMTNMMEVERILEEVYTAASKDAQGYMCFDGGAHKGYHTTRMVALPGCEKVIAVEADPTMAEKLRASLDRVVPGETRIQVVEAALQRDPAVTQIPWGSSSSHEGRSSIISTNPDRPTIWGNNPDMEYRETASVAATTIDKLAKGSPHPILFLKLDLEGADLAALFGARDTLASDRPIVAFENSIHSPKVHGFTIEEVVGYFYGLGYVPMNFAGEPLNAENWFGFFEAWAAPRERSEWLSAQLKAALERRGF